MTCFSPEVIEEAKSSLDCPLRIVKPFIMWVRVAAEDWRHDSQEEFYADIRKEISSYNLRASDGGYSLQIGYSFHDSTVAVEAPTRAEVEHIFACFEKSSEQCKIPPTPLTDDQVASLKPVIFIGHGRSPQWRDLKDHLHEKHGYRVQAYEIGARAGHAIRDILEEMLDESSFAILVMTGEDKTQSGHVRARQNVVHELGLFQGRLGFARAIILLERGVQEFSNIQGIHQIRFSKKNIKETFGDVLATLVREFGTPGSNDDGDS